MALECVERWNDASFIPFLETLVFKKKWLEEYKESIVKRLIMCEIEGDSKSESAECIQLNGKEGNVNETHSKDVFVLDVLCDENGFAAVPFDLSGQEGAVVYVDWHDGGEGNLEELTDKSSSLKCIHRYAEPKTMHRIEVFSPDWSRVCICGVDSDYCPNAIYPPQSFAGIMARCHWHLKSPLPPLKGTAVVEAVQPKKNSFIWNPEFREGTMDSAMTLFFQIEELPEDLFSKNLAASFNGTFARCLLNCPIPNGIFRNQTEAESFDSCFKSCSFSSDFPEWVFQDCTKAQIFHKVFANSTLSSIPEGMFYGCAAAKNYGGAFSGTHIKELPKTGLFSHSPEAECFDACFYKCRYLESAPNRLFSGTSASSFHLCFAQCTDLESIGDIFAHCESAENFSLCFSGCENLSTVPSNLFLSCRNAQTFHKCFENCTSLTAIGYDFFKGPSEAAEDFSFVFQGCTGITRIPDKLFDGCAYATTFAGAFEDCRSLEIVPMNVFRGCRDAESFERTFAKCSSLHAVDVNLFSWVKWAENFRECFDGCASLVNASLRIDSEHVKNAEGFYPMRLRSRRDEILSVCVPFNSTTWSSFRDAQPVKGWQIETYSA